MFTEVQFPADISYGSAGGPEYSTDILITHNGYEQRNQNWAQARLRYNVAYGVKTNAQLAEIIAFFRARKGQAHGFRFKDWTDYTALAQPIGTGDGSQAVFQLTKTYHSGSAQEQRVIQKPVSGSVKLFFDSVLQAGNYTVDAATGIATFDTPPANGVSILADFEFDVPVRFATDRLSASLEDYGVYSVRDLPLIEVR